ncbi:unnamed protein product [Dovyalis caffra]|uniref:Uncharacterized protein n=1 Tax=Dovyalis caffra TaxID=77055 RepID=A0AAV1RT13_9ROSI|nr:unnamed protein product [Dovyalis caffra]
MEGGECIQGGGDPSEFFSDRNSKDGRNGSCSKDSNVTANTGISKDSSNYATPLVAHLHQYDKDKG